MNTYYRPTPRAIWLLYMLAATAAAADGPTNARTQFEFAATLDIATVVQGGAERGAAVLGNISATAETDTGAAGWWENGTLLVALNAQHGDAPSEYIGDLQGANNVEANNRVTVFQLWYEHHFANGARSLLVGWYDYNSEFYTLDAASLFINSSFGIGPEVAQVSPPLYPATALSLRGRIQPSADTYVMALIADGYFRADPDAPHHRHLIPKERDGIFYAAEWGWQAAADLAPKLAVGAWHHAKDGDDAEGNRLKPTSGLYAIGETRLYTDNLRSFVQLGGAQADRNDVDRYLGIGIVYTPLTRPDDRAGLAIAHAGTSRQHQELKFAPARAETVVELSYRAQVSRHVSLQPDLQYIMHPDADRNLDNAWVLHLRTQATF